MYGKIAKGPAIVAGLGMTLGAIGFALFLWPDRTQISLDRFLQEVDSGNVESIDTLDGLKYRGDLKSPISLGGNEVVRFFVDMPTDTATRVRVDRALSPYYDEEEIWSPQGMSNANMFGLMLAAMGMCVAGVAMMYGFVRRSP